ncbi:MAG: glycoside-pentoside-hexuronide (GPH):cation symporter [Oscillospiraceae bacterium]|nr:glycoside-pentoside-hexuronide (GPH):cation symporter [Oscillospiraceae bacterium]
MEATSTPTNSKMITKILYAAGDIGCNFVWTFVSGFLMLYYTDSVGVSAAFVGTMFFVSRIFDGASDIGIGLIIDRTNTRWGKARPWLLWFCIPFVISLMLLFRVPDSLSDMGRNIYIYATYLFLVVICYSFVNLAYNALLPRFSLTVHDRNVVAAVRGLAVVATALAISILTPILLDAFGGVEYQETWGRISTLYAGIALVMILLTFFGVKEKIPSSQDDGSVDKVPIKKALAISLKNKYFYVATGLFVVFYASMGLGGVTIFFARDVMGDANLLGLISGVLILPMLLATPFLPALYKKFGKRNVMFVGALIMALGCGLQLIRPDDLMLYVIFAILRGLGSIMFSMPIFTLAADIVDLDEHRHGLRAEGLITSVNSFGMKVGTGFGAALVGWVLAHGNYDADAAVQGQDALNAMIALQISIPMILSVILAILLIFWDIEKHNIGEKKSEAEA